MGKKGFDHIIVLLLGIQTQVGFQIKYVIMILGW